jgi:uncharacterized membrane protein
MIKKFFNDEKKLLVPAFSFPSICQVEQVEDLRDALANILQNLVSCQETKDATDAYSLYLLSEMVIELTKDVDILNKKEGGEK